MEVLCGFLLHSIEFDEVLISTSIARLRLLAVLRVCILLPLYHRDQERTLTLRLSFESDTGSDFYLIKTALS